ncbi:M56 family metallopeptidase [Hymenobacter sp. BT770]|uniref:M56 family metallopeptidase n=1 Tax=Hymenobacter sp. BT770 TaxID=2886942 RepID=UPI001D1009E2|nr:M56 family metallopeptidase [Hymenobacter sp. BT770]MCC3152904.1 M48 family metalloprotease [Hymenobacter sp. BT770]MDO3414979.1 M56 family metallopeptidase [Hymenobacter sp. BT770]
MTTLDNFVSPALTRALGWTLLHSLWQGALVAAVLAGALLLLRRQRAEVRYVASAGALGVVVALAGITFGLYFNSDASTDAILPAGSFKTVKAAPVEKQLPVALASADAHVSKAATPVTVAGVEPQSAKPTAALAASVASEARPAAPGWLATGLRYFDHHLPLLVLMWLLGLLAMSLRMLGGLLYVQRLRRYRVRPLSPMWQDRLAALAQRSGVRQPVVLLESALVQVPVVVGHLRPVILLPLGVVAGLSPASLEAILAHELAHVLRRDYLVNLLQTVAEVLFFYHPAVWFVASCVRTERENCCDDTATALCGGDSLRLARALTALAEWSQSAMVPATPRLALAAIGKRGALLSRVRRLVQRRPAAPTMAEGILAGALVLGGLGLLGSSVAFAGPFAQPALTPGKLAAFNWQGGGTAPAPAATRADDNLKSAAGTAKTIERAATDGATTGDETRTSTAASATPEAETLVPAQDTLLLRGRAARRRLARQRDGRRVIVDRRNMAPRAFPGTPGTVVITKDKKGRVTDLVVNGQHVDTDADNGKGKRKIKIKDKKGDDRQYEVIQVDPSYAPRAEAFVYRGGSGGGGTTYLRTLPRVYSMPMPMPAPEAMPRVYRGITPGGLNELRRLSPAAPGTYRQLEELNRTYRLQSPGAAMVGPGPNVAETRSALRAAERALREAASVKNLSSEQRKRIDARLKDVQSQLKRLDSSPRTMRFNGATVVPGGGRGEVFVLSDEDRQERNAELRARKDEVRARQEEVQARQEEVQARKEEIRERIRETQDERREERIRTEERRNGAEEAIVNELLKDGLIKDRNNFQFEFKNNELRIDDKVQPKPVLDKYRKLYEKASGHKVTANSSILMGRSGDVNDMPPPPRPPKPPRPPRPASGIMAPAAPAAPSMSEVPAPPRPPRAPSVDTRTLRDELRKDGLIGQDDKNFQLQLNDSGLTVNGKRQSEELATKYRKLVGHEGPGQNFNVNVSLD